MEKSRSGLSRAAGWMRTTVAATVTHPLTPVAILGLLIRLALAPFTSWTWDMVPSYMAGMDMLSGASPYHSMFYSYPPAWAYTFAPPIYLLSVFVSPADMGAFIPSLVPVSRLTQLVNPIVTTPAFNLAVKSPLILADLAMGLLISRIVREMVGLPAAKRAFAIWFLNPLVILAGSVNGQFDVFPSLFVLFSIYFLHKGEFLLGGGSLALSMGYKLYAIYLLPVYLVPLLAVTLRGPRSAWQRTPIVRFGIGVLAVALMFAVFFPWDTGVTAVFRRVSTPSYGGFTPFLLASNFDVAALGAIVSLASIGATLVGTSWLGWRALRPSPSTLDPFRIPGLAATNVVGLFLIFTFSPLVNPQYLLWILPAMIILFFHDRASRWFVDGLSLLGCLFIFSLAGPLVVFYPLSVWTGVLATPVINESVAAYWGVPGPFGGFLWTYFVSTISWIGYLFLLLRAKSAFAIVRGRSGA